MKDISGLVVFLIFLIFSVFASIRNILVGKGRIKNPMYDNEEKLKYIYKIGLFTLIPESFIIIFLIIILFLIR
jgi:hypothetical protein